MKFYNGVKKGFKKWRKASGCKRFHRFVRYSFKVVGGVRIPLGALTFRNAGGNFGGS